MSKLQVDDIVNKDDTGSAGFSKGAVVTGIATATSFDGNLTGTATNAQGLTGTPNLNVGIVTANSGIRVGAGQSISAVSGTIAYYGDGSNLTGVESWNQMDTWLYGAG